MTSSPFYMELISRICGTSPQPLRPDGAIAMLPVRYISRVYERAKKLDAVYLVRDLNSESARIVCVGLLLYEIISF